MEHTPKERYFDMIMFGPAQGQPKLSTGAALQKIEQGLQVVEELPDDNAARDREGKEAVLKQADTLLTKDVIEPQDEQDLQMLAGEFARPVASQPVQAVAQVNKMAQAGDELLVDLRAVYAQRQRASQALRSQLALEAEQVEFGVGRTAASVVQLLIDPSEGPRYRDAVREAFPEAEIGAGVRAAPAFRQAAEWLLRQDPQVAAERLKQFASSLDTLGAVVDSPFDKLGALALMREALEDGSAVGNRVTADDVFNVVDVLLPVAGVAGAAKRIFSPGHLVGTAPALSARTTKGQETLLKAAESPAGDSALEAVGTDAGKVVAGAALPKPPVGDVSHLAADSVPYESIYFTAAERAAAKANFRLLDGNTAMLHTNKSKIEDFNGGFRYEQVYGPANGGFFKSQSQARAFMADIDPDLKFDLVKDELSGGYLTSVKGERFYVADDKGVFDRMIGSGLAKTFFGKGQYMGAELRALGTWAATRSAAKERELNDLTQPFFKLRASQRQILNEVLVEFTDRKWLSASELAARGADDAAIAAYNGIRKASDEAWRIANTDAVEKALNSGGKFVRVGNQKFVGEVVPEVPRGVREVLHAGDNIAIEVRPDMDGRFVKLPSPQRHGDTSASYQYVFVPNKGKGSKAVSDIRRGDAVLNYRPGYFGVRRYTAPYFIKRTVEVMVDGNPVQRTIVHRTARSEKSAKAWIAAQENPGQYKLEVDRGARGTAGNEVFDDDLAWSGRRRDDYIPDIDLELGGARGPAASRIGNVEQAIRAMQHVAAIDHGLSKANRLMAAQWTKTYGKQYGEFSVNKPILMRAEGREMSAEAEAMHKYIVRNMGLDAESTGAQLAKTRLDIADWFWNRHNRIADFFGDEISGRSNTLVRLLKSATYVSFLALNPTRQMILQATMMPTYLGVRGAGSYALSGQLFRDWGALAGSYLSADEVAYFAKAANGERKLTDASLAALDDWNRSGLSRLVDANILTIDTVADSAKATTGTLATHMNQGLDLVKRAGIDTGIQADKRFAFLVARNRFLTDNKLPLTTKLNDDQLKEVAGFAEDLSLNQNRSDVLAVQRGYLGLVTQFMSHQLKMTGRIIDQAKAFTPKGWNETGEAGLTGIERRRMAAMAFLGYGTAGYGINELVFSAERAAGAQLPEDVRALVTQGLFGSAVESFFRLADTDGDPTELAFSSSFSPVNFVGPTVAGVGGMLASLASLNPSKTWEEAAGLWEKLEPASFGLATSISEIIKMGLIMSFNGHLFAGDRSQQARVLLRKGLETFPMFNQIAQGVAIMEHGMVMSRSGNTVVEASLGEGIARSILGIRDRASEEVTLLNNALYDQAYGASETGRRNAVQEQAREDWDRYAAPFFEPGTNVKEMMEKLDLLFTSRMEAFGVYGYAYQEQMQRLMLQRMSDKSLRDKMVESWLTQVAAGDLPVGSNTIDSIRQGADFQGKEKFIQILESLTERLPESELDKPIRRR